jgi:SWI/SNF related-matrix-associated actin-dependent regulator of chromatin subfamily C
MDEEWTDNEVLRLLEGVDRFDDDWLMISEHVGSRSKEQCITKFLQLPINEEFLTAQLTKKELQELPFGELPNPIMTTIAFLAGHVNPGVGAAAAKTALKELMKSDEGKHEPMEIDGTNVKLEGIATDTNLDEIKTENELEDGSTALVEKKEVDHGVFSKKVMKRATTSAIKSAVENARKLASYEDQEIQHWTRLAVKTMVDKLSFKVNQYDELENSLTSEIQELDKQQTLLAGSIEAFAAQHYPLNGDTEDESSNKADASSKTETTANVAST